MHDSDFRIVKSKNKNNRRKSYLITTESATDGVAEVLGNKLKSRLSEIEREITCEEFYPDLVALLREQAINRVVCLGLGHFATCPTSRVQLALLLALTKSLKQLTDIQLQDPAFTDPEIVFLRSLNFQVLLDNAEGRFATAPNQRVLYYLPHCPKALTNNLLLTNWTPEALQNSVIVCNSFQALLTNTLDREIATEAEYVQRIAEYTIETGLSVSERHFDSFNDTSIHRFDLTNFRRITDPLFWTIKGDQNPTNDPELITKQLQEKLQIN